MSETFQQTQEAPQPSAEPIKKPNNALIVVLLVLIFLVLGALVAYQFLTKEKADNDLNKENGSTEQMNEESSGSTEETDTSEPQASEEDQVTTTTSGIKKPDIDADLKNLDELDLSNIENDYAEDQLGEF